MEEGEEDGAVAAVFGAYAIHGDVGFEDCKADGSSCHGERGRIGNVGRKERDV